MSVLSSSKRDLCQGVMHHCHVALDPQQMVLSMPEYLRSDVHGHEGRGGQQEVVQAHYLSVLRQRVGVPSNQPRKAEHAPNTAPAAHTQTVNTTYKFRTNSSHEII